MVGLRVHVLNVLERGVLFVVLDDLVVKYIGVEADPTKVTVSGADSVIAAL